MGVYMARKLKLIKERRQTPVEKKSNFDAVIYYIEQPFMWILYLTSCPVLDEQYDKLRHVYFPVTGSLFYWYIIHPTFDATYLYIPLPIGLVVSMFLMYILDPLQPPKWSIIFCLFGVISGLAWTYLLVDILIDLLGVLGLILNLDKAYLGLTILAIGNALPDALTTLALIKQGVGTMAISGAYAGQLFGFLVGFGISMLKLTIIEGPQTFDLFSDVKDNLLELVVLAVAALTLIFTFVYGVVRKFKMDRLFGAILFFIYGAFILSCTVIAIFKAAHDF